MNHNVYSSPPAYALDESYQPAAPLRFFKAWFLFIIASSICGFVAAFAVGAIVAAILAGAGVEMKWIVAIVQGLGLLIGLPISFVCYRWSVSTFVLPQVGTAAPGDVY